MNVSLASWNTLRSAPVPTLNSILSLSVRFPPVTVPPEVVCKIVAAWIPSTVSASTSKLFTNACVTLTSIAESALAVV